jgi:hypothetical protein
MVENEVVVAQSTVDVEDEKEGYRATGISALDSFETFVRGRLALLAGEKNRRDLTLEYCEALDTHLGNICKPGWQPPPCATGDGILDRFYDEQSWMLQGLQPEQPALVAAYVLRLRTVLAAAKVRHGAERANGPLLPIAELSHDTVTESRRRTKAKRDDSNFTPAQKAYHTFRQPEQTLLIDVAILRKIDTSPAKKVSFSVLFSQLVESGFLTGEHDRNALIARNNRMKGSEEPLLDWTSKKPIVDIAMTPKGLKHMIKLLGMLETPEKGFLQAHAPWVLPDGVSQL